MRRLLHPCLIFLAFLPLAAHADSLTFTLDQTITWTLSLPVQGGAVNVDDFRVDEFNIDFNGHETTAVLDLFTSAIGGGFNLTYFFPGGPASIIGQGPQLFSGTTDDPTILLGDFTFTDGKSFDTLSITSDAVATAPEPSTFLLLGTGGLGLLTSIRRRRVRANLPLQP